MPKKQAIPKTVDQYILACPPQVGSILRRIRRTVRAVAPQAVEVISYRMPAFKMKGVLVYFAAFKNHIGLYPPVSGDPELVKAVSRYAGEKGNLRFPLDQPIPYDLIERVVKHRVNQDRAGAKTRKGRGVAGKKGSARHARDRAP